MSIQQKIGLCMTYKHVLDKLRNRNSSVGIASRLVAGQLRNRTSIPGKAISFLCSTASIWAEAHPASYTIDTRDAFCEGKAARA
jgi:hypothetical protein